MALNNLGLGFVFTAQDLASGVMGKLDRHFRGLDDLSDKTAAHVEKSFQRMTAGMSVMAAGVAGLSILSSASDAARDFEYQIARVRTVIDESALSTERAREETMLLAEAYGTDAIQQADALYETISSGVTDATEAVKLLTVANEFAVGGSAELAGAVDVLTSAVNTYREQGLGAAEASDVMFTAIAAGKTTASELSRSLGEVAPTAQALGVSFEELNAALAALTVQGIRTPQAVTGLNALLSNLAKPTKEAAGEAARLGIQFNATALKTKGLSGVLAQLAGNAKVNNDTFPKLFGSIDGIKTALALTAQDGAKFLEVLEMMKGATGATKKAFDIMSKTAKFQEDRFNALRKNVLILVGEALEPLRAKILKVANTLLEGFAKIPKPIRDFSEQMFALASGVAVVVGGILALQGAFGLVRLAGASSIFPILKGFSLLNPWVLLTIASVAALKIAWDKNFGGIQEKVQRVWDVIKLFAQGVIQLFTEGGFSGAVMEALGEPENAGLKDFLINIYALGFRVYKFFLGVWEGFAAAVSAAEPAFIALWTAIENLWNTVVKLVTSLFDLGNGVPSDEIRSFGQILGDYVGRILEAIIQHLAIVIDFFAAMIEGFMAGIEAASPFLEYMWTIFTELWSSVQELMTAIFGTTDATGGLGEFFSWLGEIVGWLAGLFGVVLVGALGLVADILRVVVEVITWVVQKFAWLAEKVQWIVDKIWGASEKAEATIEKAEASPAVQKLAAEAPSAVVSPATPSVPGETPTIMQNMAETIAATRGKFTVAKPTLAADEEYGPPVQERVTPAAKASRVPTRAAAGQESKQNLKAAFSEALKEAGFKELNATIVLQLDGEVLARAQVKAKKDEASRSYKNMAPME